MTEDRRSPPPSPCNNTCILDPVTQQCVGCLRTLQEIGAWGQMSADEQWDVIDAIAQRRAAREEHGSGSQ